MTAKSFARALCLAGSLVIAGLSQSALATTAVTSSADGLDVSLTVLGLTTASLGPTDLASGTAPNAYSSSKTVASVNAAVALPLLSLKNALGSLISVNLGGLTGSTGIVNDTASSAFGGTGLTNLSDTATSTVNGTSLNLGLKLLTLLGISLGTDSLSIGATTLSSTTTARDTTGIVSYLGTSTIQNLTLGGNILGKTITYSTAAGGSTPVDYDLLAANRLTIANLAIYANYQTPTKTGAVVDGLNTAALAIRLNSFVFGGSVISGTILVGNTQARILAAPPPVVAHGVPEPATWAMMLVGFGVTGALARRRRYLAAA